MTERLRIGDVVVLFPRKVFPLWWRKSVTDSLGVVVKLWDRKTYAAYVEVEYLYPMRVGLNKHISSHAFLPDELLKIGRLE